MFYLENTNWLKTAALVCSRMFPWMMFFFWVFVIYTCGVFRPLDGWICLRTSMVCNYIIICIYSTFCILRPCAFDCVCLSPPPYATTVVSYILYILWFMCVFVSTWWFAVATTCSHAIRADHAQHESSKVIQTKVLETHVSALRLFRMTARRTAELFGICIVKCHSVLRSTSALGSSLPVCFLGDDGLVHVRTSASRKARSYVFKCVEYWHALAGLHFSYRW